VRSGGTVSACLMLAVLVSAGCSTSSTSDRPLLGGDLLIGVPMSLTGNLSREGALSKRGYDLWQDWVNRGGGITVGGARHRVRLLYADDQSSASASALVTQQLITQQKVRFLLGPYGSPATAADAAVAEQNHVPFVSTNGAARTIYSHGYRYVFGVQSPAADYLLGVLDMAAAFSPRPATVAVLSADDSFSLEATQAVLDHAPKAGMQVVYTARYPSGSTDLSALMAEVRQKNPEMVLNSGHLVEAIAINKAARDLRLGAKLYAYSVGPATPDFARALGADANLVFTGSEWSSQVRYRQTFYLSAADYVQAYQQKFGTTDEPPYPTADATAGGLALEKAIVNAGSLDAGRVRAALASLDVITFFGRIKFDRTHLDTFKPMVVEQVQDGQPVAVWPPESAAAKPVYPAPPWVSRAGVAPGPAPKLPVTGAAPG
jgi:branched-chain amino acid transport system substrate-binding protein